MIDSDSKPAPEQISYTPEQAAAVTGRSRFRLQTVEDGISLILGNPWCLRDRGRSGQRRSWLVVPLDSRTGVGRDRVSH